MNAAIPLLRVAGSHADVGRRIGQATAATIRTAAGHPFDAELVAQYRSVTLEHLPWVVAELDAAADAAEVDRLAIFAASVEELSSDRVEGPAPARCTDLVAVAPATRDGHVLVGHTNDLEAGVEDHVVAIEWRVPGEPVVFTLGLGPWISVGWNSAGLSVTGNELAPNDERIGIPRLLQVRDALTRRTLDEAVGAVLHPERASSYNWVLAHASGAALNVEGSATDAAIGGPVDGVLAHANHYAEPAMSGYERSTRVRGSARRARRAAELLRSRNQPVSRGWLRDALCDHANAPDSLCRHGDTDGVKTVFWCVADVTAGEIAYGRGNPCSSRAQTYRFGPR